MSMDEAFADHYDEWGPVNRCRRPTRRSAPTQLTVQPGSEWLGLIDIAGLELEALYGSFDREPLDSESREYVFVTRRPLAGSPLSPL